MDTLHDETLQFNDNSDDDFDLFASDILPFGPDEGELSQIPEDVSMDIDPPIHDESDSIDDKATQSEEEEPEHINGEIISLLEDIIVNLVSQLYDSLSYYDTPGARPGGSRITFEIADRKKPLNTDGTFGTRTITYPRNTRFASSKPLAQFLRVVDLMHEALCSGTPTTKRDMFYKDVALFGSQSVVDRLVDDIAATIGVSRSDLFVRASAKGLFCGSALALYLKSGEVVRGNDLEGALIPASADIARFELKDDLSWVLVVEKEAVFQTLCHLDFANHPSLPGPGLIITGKGYPDIATRQLVANLADNLPDRIPIMAMVDADPHGIDILSVYKFGSASMGHEQGLVARRIRWVGVLVSELSRMGIEKDCLLPIKRCDEKKALSLLKRPGLPRKWRKELQHMVFTRRKAEIEVLCANDHRLTDTGATSPSQSLLVDYLARRISETVTICANI